MNRLRLLVLGILLAATCGCSFDIFHDTTWLTACDLDPATPGCSDAGSDVSDDADEGGKD